MRRSVYITLFFLLGIFSVGGASAQTACPQGVTPGSSQCLPTGTGATSAPPPPRARWIKTWGAMAEDSLSSKVGTSTGEFSRRAAQRAAVRKCESMGGEGCKAVFSYENTCAVIAEPVELQGKMVGFYQDAPTIEEASRLVLPLCRNGNGGRECRVIYSNCTAPILRR
ncbi:DUF4189 domain-containing protein [Pseudoxanthomonas japonensis]|jgi:hypothetical protein|uniref:DUF4189 domain-containing protein n=1 Tax=Pseudoxanthomonas japonensis TaxID=69284 RepID=UPI000DB060D4|nr:MAG: hypothetical protein DI562_12115 [Stenotrophomonas acidaminiphila]